MPARKKKQPNEVVVRVKVMAEGKKKRRRTQRRKGKIVGGKDLALPTGTRTLYGQAILPPPPQQIYQVLPQQFQQQLAPNLLEDVRKERNKLLEDIGRQTQSQIAKSIAKAQGAEQRSELNRMGWIEPIQEPRGISTRVSVPMTSMMGKESDELKLSQAKSLGELEDIIQAKNIAREKRMAELDKEPTIASIDTGLRASQLRPFRDISINTSVQNDETSTIASEYIPPLASQVNEPIASRTRSKKPMI